MLNRLLACLFVFTSNSATALFWNEDNSPDIGPLIKPAIAYGVSFTAWNRHPVGRAAMGYRYMAREYFLQWLAEKSGNDTSQYPGLKSVVVQAVTTRADTQLKDSTRNLKPNLAKELEGKLSEWSEKKASKKFYGSQKTSFPSAVQQCSKNSTLSEKCQSAIDHLSKWQPDSVASEPLFEQLLDSLINFLRFTNKSDAYPIYEALVDSRDQFHKELNILFYKEVSPEDIASELLNRGIYFDVIHNKVRYFKARKLNNTQR
ncbi:hypothetical protein [Endozoicomonas sp. OPT23]|uniref:hypothetical protein n=1 Tax=Endozoicomonas sp. OPT23 TaxID=2072845 RepID=UPI00129B7AAA|nr:hypothetical protein [Endozoicomonas sp. OPT23]